MVTHPCKHGHRVMENVGATLDTLIHPTGTMFLLVNRYAVGLPATVIDRVNDGHIEFIRVFSQMMSTRHSWQHFSNLVHSSHA